MMLAWLVSLLSMEVLLLASKYKVFEQSADQTTRLP
jgi:hypothetical protein